LSCLKAIRHIPPSIPTHPPSVTLTLLFSLLTVSTNGAQPLTWLTTWLTLVSCEGSDDCGCSGMFLGYTICRLSVPYLEPATPSEFTLSLRRAFDDILGPSTTPAGEACSDIDLVSRVIGL